MCVWKSANILYFTSSPLYSEDSFHYNVYNQLDIRIFWEYRLQPISETLIIQKLFFDYIECNLLVQVASDRISLEKRLFPGRSEDLTLLEIIGQRTPPAALEVNSYNIRILTIFLGQVATKMWQDIDYNHYERNKNRMYKPREVATKIVEMIFDAKRYKNREEVQIYGQ